jgi:hypothetical protein
VRSLPLLREAMSGREEHFPILFLPLKKPTSLACHHLPFLKCEKQREMRVETCKE